MHVVIAGELHGVLTKQFSSIEKVRSWADNQDHPNHLKESKYYQAGDRVGIFDLDFGSLWKICRCVCPLLDGVAGLHQVDPDASSHPGCWTIWGIHSVAGWTSGRGSWVFLASGNQPLGPTIIGHTFWILGAWC